MESDDEKCENADVNFIDKVYLEIFGGFRRLSPKKPK